MRIALVSVILSLCAAGCYAQTPPAGAEAAAAPKAAAAPAMDSKEAATVASYSLGLSTGRSIKSEGVEIDLDSFVQGLRDGAAGAAKPKYTEQQIRQAMQTFQRDMMTKMEQKHTAAADKNRTDGEAFLANNRTKAGVKTLPSGLQYEVLKAGAGASPKATDTVKVHYEGTLLDGSVFDSSLKRNQPAVFPVNGVIPGWTEALQLMKVGDKWKIYLPSDLAYGARGAGEKIGPNAMLTFEVELLGIMPPAKAGGVPAGGAGDE